MAINKGVGAVGSLTQENSGSSNHEITPLKSGVTLKVAVKSSEDIGQYFGYSIFKKVYTFVPKNPATRDKNGFVTGNPTVWDRAAQYYSELAKQASGDEQEKLKAEARLYRGKERYLLGFYDLTNGKDIVVDLTKAQALGVYQTIKEYEDELGELAFKLSKTGESTSTTVTLSPIVNMKKGLTDAERANFEAIEGKPFDSDMFDNVLYEADEAEQIENLKKAGFDVSLIGLSGATKADEEPKDEALDIEESELPF